MQSSMSPQTRNAIQVQTPLRKRELTELGDRFYPSLLRTPQIPLYLDRLRHGLFRNVVFELLEAAASDETLYETIRSMIPHDIEALNTREKRILDLFHEFEAKCYDTQDDSEMTTATSRIADSLCAELGEVEKFPIDSNSEQAKFILGILITILNEVAKLGQNKHPRRRHMYRLLMQGDPDLSPHLNFTHIDTFSEEEWKAYAADVQLLVCRFTTLEDDMIAPDDVMRELRKVLPKILPANVDARRTLISNARSEAKSENVESSSPDMGNIEGSDDGDVEEERAEEAQSDDESSESTDERSASYALRYIRDIFATPRLGHP